MQQLTVRGFGQDLVQRMRELAARDGISLNKVALRLLRQGAGLEDRPADADCIGDSLDRFIGTWTDEETDEFLAEIEETFGQIDEEHWR